MKLAIGTGNFNKKFFLKGETLNNNNKKNLIRLFNDSCNTFIDTSPEYGNAEYIIGNNTNNNSKIITKISKLKKIRKNITQRILKNISYSLQKLNKKSVYGILLHSSTDFLNNKTEFKKALALLKIRNLTKKTGISIYNIEEIFQITQYWIPDFVQVPYNIFNRDIENKKFKKIIKKYNIEIHVRSIFFKGLLTDRNLKVKKLSKWNKYFNKWFDWCKKNKIEPYKACFLFAQKNNDVQNIVISFDNIKQLEEVMKIRNKYIKFPNFHIKDKYFLNPSIWS